MTDLISVIVPIYKVELYLDECVQSIVDQTYPHLEIILVDDGSPDNCGVMCDAWAERDSRIKVIHKPNGGLSDARNAGLEIAMGEYISFIDSDDWIRPGMYEQMLAVMKREQADICACRILSCFPDHELEWGCPEYLVTGPEQALALLYNEAAYPASAVNKLYHRSCWKNFRFPVGKICEDAFTVCPLAHNAQRIVLIPEAYYCYRTRPESIMTSRFTPKRMDEEEVWRTNYEFIRAHYPSLFRNAYDFYLEKVNILLHTISKDEREHFAQEYETLHGILARNLGYIIFSSSMGLKRRVRLLLDFLCL